MQNALCHLEKIITVNDILPEDITEITVKLSSLADLPLWKTTDVKTHTQAQFSAPFVFSVAAHRIKTGPAWQSEATLGDRRIHEFMKKVRLITDLDDNAGIRPEVEVVTGNRANKKTYFEVGISPKYEMTDDDIVDKFKRNSSMLLNDDQAQKVMADIQALEDIGDISQMLTTI